MSNSTETPVSYAAQAVEMIAQLRAMTQKVRGFGFLSKAMRQKLAVAASVDDSFLLHCAVALDDVKGLRDGARITGEELRDAIAFTNAFEPVVAQMRRDAQGLEDAITKIRAEAGTGGSRTYNVSKQFNRPDSDVLVPHIRDMARTIKRRRKKLAAPDPQPPAAAAEHKAGGA